MIICDECHGLSDAAQDVFLADTEFLDDKVYMIMLTTELDKLKASLRSRALPIHFNTLSDLKVDINKFIELINKNIIID